MKKLFLLLTGIMILIGGLSPVIPQPLTSSAFGIAKFEEQIKQNPSNKGAYMALCYLYSQEKQYDKMLETMATVLKRFDKDVSIAIALNDYTLEFIKEHNYKIAEKISTMVAGKYRNNTDAALIRGEILLKLNRLDEAISFYNGFLAKNPKDLPLYDRLTDFYIYKGNYPAAFKTITKAQETAIDNIYYYFMQGLTFQPYNEENALKYFDAHVDKLDIANDFQPRIKVAEKIRNIVAQKNASCEDILTLVDFLEEQGAPKSYMIIQIRYALKRFPGDSTLLSRIEDIYNEIGISNPLK